MDIYNLIDRLNNELDKLNKLKNNEFDTSSFFTDNEHFNDDHQDYINNLKNNFESSEKHNSNNTTVINKTSENIEPDNETKALTVVNHNYLMSAQIMFKKTIKFSLKSFLISISLSFLNLFI